MARRIWRWCFSPLFFVSAAFAADAPPLSEPPMQPPIQSGPSPVRGDLAMACGPDIARLCRGVPPGGGGQGLPQDNVRSHMWFALAKANGYANAAAALQELTAKMTALEIERSLDMAKRCQEANYEYCGELATSVPMHSEGGIYVVPVLINDAITLNFVVDSGAADVSIPADVVMTLMRTGTLKETDFLGEKTYVLADGSKVPSQTFRIRSLKVGNKVLENVTGSVAAVQGNLLLGQSFLSRFKSWSIDNTKHALVFE